MERARNSTSNEYQKFNMAMTAILRANPKAVEAAVDAEIEAKTVEGEAGGEHTKG